jgi:hypothetical protein
MWCWWWTGRSPPPRPTALLPPSSDGKPEAATAVAVAPDDEHEDARNMLSCIWMTSNKLGNLLHLVGWFSWKERRTLCAWNKNFKGEEHVSAREFTLQVYCTINKGKGTAVVWSLYQISGLQAADWTKRGSIPSRATPFPFQLMVQRSAKLVNNIQPMPRLRISGCIHMLPHISYDVHRQLCLYRTKKEEINRE